jgi:hypothetical protein
VPPQLALRIVPVPEDTRPCSIKEVLMLGADPSAVTVQHKPHMACPEIELRDPLLETGS